MNNYYQVPLLVLIRYALRFLVYQTLFEKSGQKKDKKISRKMIITFAVFSQQSSQSVQQYSLTTHYS